MNMMFLHYLKSAVRSLMKYKVQTTASMVGLALGFVCFALSAVWVRYEQTFDSFHREADRMYLLGVTNGSDGYMSVILPFPMAEAVRQMLPEVEDIAAFSFGWEEVSISADCKVGSLERILCDTAFVRMFDIKLASGSWSFLENTDEIALTEEGARKIFGTTEVLGREVYCSDKAYRISALLSDWDGHSNFSFSLIGAIEETEKDDPIMHSYYVCLRLFPDADRKKVSARLKDLALKNTAGLFIKKPGVGMRLEPLTDCRHTVFRGSRDISLYYIRLFSALGLMLIILALVNFFSMLVSRMHVRRRELALRIACGSSRGGLTGVFLSELLLILSGAGLLGMILMETVEKPFSALSGIGESIRLPVAVCILLLMAFTFLITWGVIVFYCRRIAARQLQPAAVRPGRFVFQKVCLGMQFGICALVVFCLSFLLLQLRYLTHTDLGFERDGRATIRTNGSELLQAHLLHELQKQPYVSEVKRMYSLFPQIDRLDMAVSSWEGKPDDAEQVQCLGIPEGEKFLKFYELRLVAGSTLTEQSDSCSVMINESLARKMDMADPVGKKIDGWTIVGVVRDFHVSAPTVPVEPVIFFKLDASIPFGKNIVVRFDESYTDRLKHFVDSLVRAEEPQAYGSVYTAREAYEEYLRSERTLQRLLTVVAVACVLITLIGVFAHVSLVCEQRRKEIAIRKVNGATAAGIFRSFLKEFFALLLLACVIAFPLGSVAMQSWVERYVERMFWPWWLYVAIFWGLVLFVVLCIGRSVWRAARENPAEVIKSE